MNPSETKSLCLSDRMSQMSLNLEIDNQWTNYTVSEMEMNISNILILLHSVSLILIFEIFMFLSSKCDICHIISRGMMMQEGSYRDDI